MNLNENRILAIIIFVIGSLIVIICFTLLNPALKNILSFFTLYGTFASLFAIILAYQQIRSLKQTSEQTKHAVETSLTRINQILSVSELSRANKIIQEIQSFILYRKTELALIRMKDLKSILIQIKYNGDLVEYTNNVIYNQQITDLSIDITNLNDLIFGTKKGVSFPKVNENLENLATTLTEFENKLKFENHDT